MHSKDFLILAAGIGSRLRPMTDSIPKGLAPVAGKPLLFHALDAIGARAQSGELRVSIVVGHLGAQLVAALQERYSFVHCIWNNDYLETNNMFSLYLALTTRDESRALTYMNGDCVYDRRVIDAAIDSTKSAITYDADRPYNEESMKIVGSVGAVKGISKAVAKADALGVSCDLYHLTPADVRSLRRRCFAAVQQGKLQLWSEVALNDAMAEGEISPIALPVRGGAWFEIDDHNDLAAASELFKDAR